MSVAARVAKSRKTALAVLILAIIIATPLGSVRSIKSRVGKVEDMFWDGVYIEEDGYTSGSISSYLDDISRAALGLVTVGNGYDGAQAETSALRSAREELLAADTISSKYEAYFSLCSAWESLTAELSSEDLTDYDSESLSEYSSLFEGASGAIVMNRYNDEVEEFNSTVLSRFPANLIARLFSVSSPETFGG